MVKKVFLDLSKILLCVLLLGSVDKVSAMNNMSREKMTRAMLFSTLAAGLTEGSADINNQMFYIKSEKKDETGMPGIKQLLDLNNGNGLEELFCRSGIKSCGLDKGKVVVKYKDGLQECIKGEFFCSNSCKIEPSKRFAFKSVGPMGFGGIVFTDKETGESITFKEAMNVEFSPKGNLVLIKHPEERKLVNMWTKKIIDLKEACFTRKFSNNEKLLFSVEDMVMDQDAKIAESNGVLLDTETGESYHSFKDAFVCHFSDNDKFALIEYIDGYKELFDIKNKITLLKTDRYLKMQGNFLLFSEEKGKVRGLKLSGDKKKNELKLNLFNKQNLRKLTDVRVFCLDVSSI